MQIICVGDNVVDCYLDQHLYYPGGNAVNVAVHCRRYGAQRVAYIGVFGDDAEAEHIKWALGQEGIEFERSRKVYAASGHPQVSLTTDGDRVFVGSPTKPHSGFSVSVLLPKIWPLSRAFQSVTHLFIRA